MSMTPREKLLLVITTLTKVFADEDNPSGIPDWEEASVREVAEFADAWRAIDQDFNKTARGTLERHMIDLGASKSAPLGELRLTYTPNFEYDPDVLDELLEPDLGLALELEQKDAYEVVPEHLKWNATKFKPFIARGAQPADIIERARTTKSHTLKIVKS